MDQTCDGMHMSSHDRGGSGPNMRPPCIGLSKRNSVWLSIRIISNYLSEILNWTIHFIDKLSLDCKGNEWMKRNFRLDVRRIWTTAKSWQVWFWASKKAEFSLIILQIEYTHFCPNRTEIKLVCTVWYWTSVKNWEKPGQQEDFLSKTLKLWWQKMKLKKCNCKMRLILCLTSLKYW